MLDSRVVALGRKVMAANCLGKAWQYGTELLIDDDFRCFVM